MNAYGILIVTYATIWYRGTAMVNKTRSYESQEMARPNSTSMALLEEEVDSLIRRGNINLNPQNNDFIEKVYKLTNDKTLKLEINFLKRTVTVKYDKLEEVIWLRRLGS